MAFEIKELEGSLFRRKPEELTSDNSPTYSGSCKIEGAEYWINAWLNKKKDSDEKYFKFSFKAKEQKSGAPKSESAPSSSDGPGF